MQKASIAKLHKNIYLPAVGAVNFPVEWLYSLFESCASLANVYFNEPPVAVKESTRITEE